ncbi:MAG: SPASM domain-containing protein [Planctomycetes bacterium]|nr:SPASM domain-containing protein [Planctomycetota bacterium]MBI3845836.1 SPASM domain-containing protein [Planctomycetota bacterium]
MPKANWPGPYCAEPWTTVFITWDGDVRTCCVGEQAFGNLAEKSIAEIWNGPTWRRFRDSIVKDEVPPNCTSCIVNQRYKNQFPDIADVLLRAQTRPKKSGDAPDR